MYFELVQCDTDARDVGLYRGRDVFLTEFLSRGTAKCITSDRSAGTGRSAKRHARARMRAGETFSSAAAANKILSVAVVSRCVTRDIFSLLPPFSDLAAALTPYRVARKYREQRASARVSPLAVGDITKVENNFSPISSRCRNSKYFPTSHHHRLRAPAHPRKAFSLSLI